MRGDQRHTPNWTAVHWGQVVRYVALTFALSWTAWVLLHYSGAPRVLRNSVAMFGPMVSALLLGGRGTWRRSISTRQPWRHRNGVVENCSVAYGLLPMLLLAGLGIALVTGFQHAVEGAGGQIELFSVSVLIVIGSITAFGEEFGWRGFLLSALEPLGGTRAAILIGVTWGIWHAPAILLDGFNYPEHRFLGVLAMVAFTVPFSIILVWLRERSGSVFPPTIAHAAFNAEAGLVLLFGSRIDSLLSAPLGVCGIIPFALFAAVLVVRGQMRVPQALRPRIVEALSTPGAVAAA